MSLGNWEHRIRQVEDELTNLRMRTRKVEQEQAKFTQIWSWLPSILGPKVTNTVDCPCCDAVPKRLFLGADFPFFAQVVLNYSASQGRWIGSHGVNRFEFRCDSGTYPYFVLEAYNQAGALIDYREEVAETCQPFYWYSWHVVSQ